MLPELTQRLLADWPRLFPGMKPGRLHYTGISGSVEGGTATFLAFNGAASRPLFAVKVLRTQEGRERLLNERDVLDYLQSRGGTLAASVPKVLLCEQVGHHWVLVQSIQQGRPMSHTLSGKLEQDLPHLRHDLQLVASWLTQLHLATQDRSEAFITSLVATGLARLEAFEATFDLSPLERDTLRLLAAGLAPAVRAGVPVQHGDFIRENILIPPTGHEVQMRVIDWTDSQRAGFPIHDLLFFITNYFQHLRTESIRDPIQAFEAIYFQQNPYSEQVLEYLKNYAAQVAVAPAHLGILFGTFLVNHSMAEYTKIVRQSKHGALPRSTIHLATDRDSNFDDAPKQQLWRHFFRVFAGQPSSHHPLRLVVPE
jgi:Ser/Thr protein kinase RdoA (MazF antagonist)